MIARVLIVAGSDSGGGAGIQADIKTVTMLGGHAMTAITAITAQNSLGVQAVLPVSAEMVLAQIDSVAADIGIDAVKIGMIGSAEVANAVADRLERLDVPIVFDPVMVATSGSVLADADTIAAFGRLMRVATLVTPNVPELQALLSSRAKADLPDRAQGARSLAEAVGTAILAKGGDADEPEVTDLLAYPGGTLTRFTNTRIETRHSHGTGCTLASGIATGLAQGLELEHSVARAIRFVRAALVAAPGLGQGAGPMGHSLVDAPFEALDACRD